MSSFFDAEPLIGNIICNSKYLRIVHGGKNRNHHLEKSRLFRNKIILQNNASCKFELSHDEAMHFHNVLSTKKYHFYNAGLLQI
jgi:hypothetical protein